MTIDLADAARRLASWAPTPRPAPNYDPVGELVATILSQNTSDLNSGRAYASLCAAFPDLTGIVNADVSDVVDAIRSGGLADLKAARIQAALRTILAINGSFDLSFLSAMSIEDGRVWLSRLPGVGRKTANCVLLFALGRPAMPVDTHVERIIKRLGVVAEKTSPDTIGPLLEAAVPPDAILGFHLDLLTLGRQVCKAARPRCPECPLREECPVGRAA